MQAARRSIRRSEGQQGYCVLTKLNYKHTTTAIDTKLVHLHRGKLRSFGGDWMDGSCCRDLLKFVTTKVVKPFLTCRSQFSLPTQLQRQRGVLLVAHTGGEHYHQDDQDNKKNSSNDTYDDGLDCEVHSGCSRWGTQL